MTGSSMLPTFSEGEILLVNRLALYVKSVERGQIVIFKNKSSGDEYIKRVIGLPGESVEIIDGSVYINGIYLDESEYLAFRQGDLAETFVPSGHVFLLGDNRSVSLDSRDASVGCVPLTALDGCVMMRISPFTGLVFY